MARQFTVDDIQEITLIRKMLAVEAVWCTILFKGCTNTIKFYASEKYSEGDTFSTDLYHLLIDGEFGEIEEGVYPHYNGIPPTTAEIESANTAKRAQLLLETDWTDTPAAQTRLSDQQKTDFADYRQALRDITTQSGWPIDPVWPTKPE
jgi:hypothetical protein